MDEELLREIAYLYYEINLTQQEIAERTFISRANISRYLAEAREKGIVEINIRYPFESKQELEKSISDTFGIDDVTIVNDENLLASEAYTSVCQMAAHNIRNQLNNDTVMGISRGRTTQVVVKNLKPIRTLPDMRLIQLSGLVESRDPAPFEENNLIQVLSNRLNCHSYCMYIPALLENRELRDMLINRSAVKSVMNKACEVNYLCLSLTTIAQWKNRLTPLEISLLHKREVTGNVMGYFYDIDGNIIETDLYNRFVMPDRCIFKASKRIAVVADNFKASALYGALRGNLVNAVVTSAKVARKLLTLSKKTEII